MPNTAPATAATAQTAAPARVEPPLGEDGVKPDEALAAEQAVASIGLDAVRNDPEVQAFIRHANKNLGVLGFTEHGFRHVGLVSSIARNVLRLLGYDERNQELAAIAGYLHDIG
ncbi:MAG TPA: hypothetical protein VFQ80_05490, partial [Thermomicrobiales bacterium]|nr:hypothetical protein [Thermomicrobiales bacterium]